MDHIAFLEVCCGTVKWEDLRACKLGVDSQKIVRAMISIPNGDTLGAEKYVKRMKGREAGGICQAWSTEKYSKKRFETGGVGSCCPRVDMDIVR